MSMQEPLFGDYAIPADTQRAAHAAFPKGNLYIQLRDQFGMLYDNQRFIHLSSHEGQPDPRAAAQPSDETPGQLTPEEVDQEIATILRMARRIRGFRRTRPAMTDAEIAQRLGIAVADIATTLRFAQGYGEIERRLKHQPTHNGAGERRSRK